MEDVIRISLGDWQYNAGIVGLYRILKHAGFDIIEYTDKYNNVEDKKLNRFINHEIIFPSVYLENFTEKYYTYLIDTYIEQISYGRIIGFKEYANRVLDMEDDEIDEKVFERINDYLKNVLKYYLKSASYKSAFDLIDGAANVVNKAMSIEQVKKTNKDIDLDVKNKIKDVCKKIIDIIDTLEENQYKKYLAGKNVIYTYIKRNWNGVSILNAQVKEKDIYREFDNYFVKPAILYLNEEKSKFKYTCHTCGSKIKDLKTNLSFVNGMGFDVARKSSHVWNFQNDIGICELCKLIYACMPAGFVYGFDKGIFINSNTSIYALIETNKKLTINMQEEINKNEGSSTYKSIVEAITSRGIEGSKFELADIQVVFYEKEKYVFNMLHKNILELIDNSSEKLKILKKGCFKENKSYIYLYETTVRQILDNKNMFLWIDKLIRYSITNKADCYYHMGHVLNILEINFEYLKEVGVMGNSKYLIYKMKDNGNDIRVAYYGKGVEHKLLGISHQILNALKTSNTSQFMDVMIRMYMYVKKEIPKEVINCLKTDEEFKVYGYAFLLGLNGSLSEKQENLESKDEN